MACTAYVQQLGRISVSVTLEDAHPGTSEMFVRTWGYAPEHDLRSCG